MECGRLKDYGFYNITLLEKIKRIYLHNRERFIVDPLPDFTPPIDVGTDENFGLQWLKGILDIDKLRIKNSKDRSENDEEEDETTEDDDVNNWINEIGDNLKLLDGLPGSVKVDNNDLPVEV